MSTSRAIKPKRDDTQLKEWESIPDAGLRDLDVRLVPCDDLGDPGDVDTPADLPERLR